MGSRTHIPGIHLGSNNVSPIVSLWETTDFHEIVPTNQVTYITVRPEITIISFTSHLPKHIPLTPGDIPLLPWQSQQAA